jgi:hypothetical protein
MTDSGTSTDSTTDRRAFPRCPASDLPWLTIAIGRSGAADLLDISEGGVLIETPARVIPTDRDVIVLSGCVTPKVVGWVERVEVASLSPSVLYRAAFRFSRSVVLSEGTRNRESESVVPAEPAPASNTPEAKESRALRKGFAACILPISGVHAVHLSSLCKTHPGTEPVHFTVPGSKFGEGRLLQVFFDSGALPTALEFAQLRQLAAFASGLPDMDFAPACTCSGRAAQQQ